MVIIWDVGEAGKEVLRNCSGCCYDKIIQLLKLSKQQRYAEVCAHNNNITLWWVGEYI